MGIAFSAVGFVIAGQVYNAVRDSYLGAAAEHCDDRLVAGL